MGWSCRAEAAEVLKRWAEACVAQTGFSTEFEVEGTRYVWAASRKEHNDGAITGTIERVVSRSSESIRVVKAMTFRIEGDGRITRAPKFLKTL